MKHELFVSDDLLLQIKNGKVKIIVKGKKPKEEIKTGSIISFNKSFERITKKVTSYDSLFSVLSVVAPETIYPGKTPTEIKNHLMGIYPDMQEFIAIELE